MASKRKKKAARRHVPQTTRRPARPTARGLTVLLASGVLLYSPHEYAVAAPLPQGTLPQSSSSKPWLGSGQATMSTSGSNMTINQSTGKVILNWDSFNISKDAAVRFVQPGTGAVALNRILDPKLNPSIIEGKLSANGQVYLINPNGIIFANGSQTNVGTLIASSLNIADNLFLKGFLSQTDAKQAVFSGNASAGTVEVQAGAELSTNAANGLIMLLAPNVQNAGAITTKDGQTIIAAGQLVYLAASADPALRGLLVAVDSGGNAVNLGKIVAERGNATLTGLMVNQGGHVSATTSVNANGSIYLVAGDNGGSGTGPGLDFERKPGFGALMPTHGGELTLAQGSVTEIKPDASDTGKITDSQKFIVSDAQLVGKTISVQRDAKLIAPGGHIALTAAADPSHDLPLEHDGSRIDIDSGATIDVSGTRDVELSAARNLLKVELRGTELADSPLLRDGFLHGKTVTVDISKGTPIANIQGYLDQIGRGVMEKTSKGGTISLHSAGDLSTHAGSTLDVSGGSLKFDSAYGQTTKLLGIDGKAYDIGSAPANLQYVGFADGYNHTDAKWGVVSNWTLLGSLSGMYIPAYQEGAAAGQIDLQARQATLAGNLLGKATPGQRQLANNTLPAGGTLILGSPDGLKGPPNDFRFPDLVLGNGAANPATDGTAPTTLDVDGVADSGFGKLAVYSNGSISLPAGNTLRLVRGEVDLYGRKIDIDGSIVVPGGTIVAATRDTATSATSSTLNVGSGALLSTRGAWVNESPRVSGGSPQAHAPIDGGSITLNSLSDLTLAEGSLLDASGGGWVRSGNKFTGGRGGSISLAANVGVAARDIASGKLSLGGSLRGAGVSGAGSLSLQAKSIAIGDNAAAAPGQLALSPAFFSQGGFGKFSLLAHDGLDVASGTELSVLAYNLLLDPGYLLRPSGSDVFSFSHLGLLPLRQRTPGSLSLKAASPTLGDLSIGAGARIATDPGGSVSMAAGGKMMIAGTVDAPAGSIKLSSAVDPNGSNDVNGYSPDQAITLASTAQLLARGSVDTLVSNSGLRDSRVLDGGSVTINPSKGYIVAEAGSLIDVSARAGGSDVAQKGAAGTGTVSELTQVGTAGTINLQSREGMVLGGTLQAAPALPTGALGGTLNLSLGQVEPLADPFNYPTGPRTLTLSRKAPTDSAPVNGMATLAAPGLASAGFASVNLKSTGSIVLDDGVALSLPRSLSLDAPTISGQGGSVSVAAPYVRLGNGESKLQAVPAGPVGTAQLNVSGQLIDLVGHSKLDGFATAKLAASSDIRAIGVADDNGQHITGALATSGDLTLQAAQVYPTTLSEFTLTSPGKISVLPNGSASVPLSAGGQLTLEANAISQQGVLRAPFGTINLNAANSLTLAKDSVTSVSGEGTLIPFGQTQNKEQWVYTTDGTHTVVFDTPPAKRINLKGQSVELAQGARLDLSGGGDLYGYEFFRGPGGSKDVLSPTNNGGKVFAVLPGLASSWAPYDPQYAKEGGAGLKVGDSVYLSGVAGLAAGTYALLPARYALLPGAFTVQVVSGYTDLPMGSQLKQADGSTIVAGYRSVAGMDLLPGRASGYLLTPSAVVRKYSQFGDSQAGTFFADAAKQADQAAPRLPNDAGQLTLNASRSLTLDGAVAFAPASGGRGGIVDITSDRIVLGAHSATPDGALQLDVARINALGAESLLIGGVRDGNGKTQTIKPAASVVELANDTASALSAPEVMLTATRQLTLDAGSAIVASGTLSNAASAIEVDGDSALLRASAGAQPELTRKGATGDSGSLALGEGASIRASGSIMADASVDTRIAPTASLAAPQLSLAASRISVGAAPDGTGGLVLTPTLVHNLSGVDALTLKSYSTLDLYNAVTLGSLGSNGLPLLSSLTLDVAGIAGYGRGDKTINAASVNLTNSSGAGFSGTADGSGTLAINALGNGTAAGTLTLGAGDKTVAGFDKVALNANGDIVGKGSGQLAVAGEMALASNRITGKAGARQQIVASGTLSTARPSGAASPAGAADLGGQLTLSGSQLTHGGVIDLPSGQVTLHATGTTGEGALTLASGALIDVSGKARTFDTTTLYAPGGQVSLVSDADSVALQTNTRIDVSGADTGGAAGLLTVKAAYGSLALADSGVRLQGQAAQGQSGAAFNLDAGSLANFSQLNTLLNTGGFDRSRGFRLRAGDVAIAAGEQVKAHKVEIAADQGAISVAGNITANGGQGGSIALWANNDVTLQAGASLDASASDAGATGGSVTLGSVQGSLSTQAGARIDVSGAQGGDVLFRAKRTANNLDVQIGALEGSIVGAGSVVIEGNRSYNAISFGGIGAGTNLAYGTVSTGLLKQTIQFADAGAAIKRRLGLDTSDPAYHVRAGIEVRSGGDLTVKSDLNLGASADAVRNDWHSGGRYGSHDGVDADGLPATIRTYAGGEPITLSLRATGNLLLTGTKPIGTSSSAVLSDGFTSTAPNGVLLDPATAGASASYRLVGGADLNGANPLAVKSLARALDGNNGDIVLPKGKFIRTGSGNIELAAARDIKLQDQTSVIYTAGAPVPAATFQNFPLPSQAKYTQDGGNISLAAQRDIVSAPTTQLGYNWLYRRGKVDADGTIASNFGAGQNTSWWVAFDQFQQGVGALAGGNVEITAGGNISNLSAAIPTTGWLAGAAGSKPDAANLHINGGGELTVQAGGNIDSGVFYVGRGKATLAAGGSFDSGRRERDTNPAIGDAGNANVYAALIAGGDTVFKLTAGGDLNLAAVLDPTVLPMARGQSVQFRNLTSFSSYNEQTGVSLLSLYGDVNLGRNVTSLVNAIPTSQRPASSTSQFRTDNVGGQLQRMPATLEVGALQGDVNVLNDLYIASSHGGALSLIAQDSVHLGASARGGQSAVPATVTMVGNDPSTIPGPLNPTSNSDMTLAFTSSRNLDPQTPLHAGDASPVKVVAATGNIDGVPESAFYLQKAANFVAGQDISTLKFVVSNINLTDVTRFEAGRDIVFPVTRNLNNDLITNSAGITVAGPGQVQVEAGRNIDLGNSNGIVTRGNLENPALPVGGANIQIMVGTGKDASGQRRQPAYDAFINHYLVAGAVRDYMPELAAYLTRLDGQPHGNVTPAELLKTFRELSRNLQAPFLAQVLYTELRETGVAHNRTGSDYERGYTAIRTLFPDSNYKGDLRLVYSQIKTEKGGDINILVPGGFLNVGLANPPGDIGKSASDLGLLALQEGAIRMMANGSVQVNQSRIFTLQGGDILAWSSTGDIDAGNGAKTATGAPPPTVVVNRATGQVTIDASSSITGSGIGQLLSKAGVTAGSVDLIAPAGTVSAGDAGINAVNLNIAAQHVSGLDNIHVSGASSGVPVVESAGLSAAVAPKADSNDAARSADQAAAGARNAAAAGEALKDGFKPTLVSVDVLCFGDECNR